MNITTIDEPFIPLGSGLPRSPGLHLTDIITAIEVEMGWRTNFWEDDPLYMAAELGFMWEEILSHAYGDRYALRPGEITQDGIIGSPDGIDVSGEFPVLEEYKCSWSSAKKTPDTNWRYMTQVKSYCYMLGLSTCIMRILYLMGFYNGQGPVYRVSKIKFEEEELLANWDMILRKAEEMKC